MTRLLKHLPKLATLGALIVLAACSDSAPTAAPVADDLIAAPAMPNIVASQALVAEAVETPVASNHGTLASAYPSNAVTYEFWYNPTTDASFILGVQMVSFPRYTICDPEVTPYGPNYWQSSCQKLTSTIRIRATTWTDAAGRPQIDFDTDLRFYKNYYNQLPAIYLRDPMASASSWGRIDYCITGGACVNEAASDPVLATQRDPNNGWLFRIIRHFSGYNVWA